MKHGNFLISLDFELLWGLTGRNEQELLPHLPKIHNAQNALKEIINLLEEYNIKCTVAFVGAMNYDSKKELKNIIPEIQPQYSNILYSPYVYLLPKIEHIYTEDLLFCKSTIEDLKNKPLVELCSHTFSHYYCLEEGQNIRDFEEDIKLAYNEALKCNIKFRSIIFPRNQVSKDYLDVCKKYEFTHYRGNIDSFLYKAHKKSNRYSIKGALRFLDNYFNLSGHNCYSVNNTAIPLKNIIGSRFFRPYSNRLFFLEFLKLRRIKRSMLHAAKNNLTYHIWWHPHNFGSYTSTNLKELKQICEYFKYLNQKYNYQSKFISEL